MKELSKIEADSHAKSLDWPSPDNTHIIGPAEAAASTPNNVDVCNIIVAAAEKLTAMMRGPDFTLFDASTGVSEVVLVMFIVYSSVSSPTCLRFVEQTHMVEAFREAGPGGLYVDLIAEKKK